MNNILKKSKQENLAKMMGSIEEYGFEVPILADGDGKIIDGHLRLAAAKKMGLKHIPVTSIEDLSPDQVRRFRLLVNKSADWDENLLALELADLMAVGEDINLTGFMELDYLLFLLTKKEKNQDDIPEIPDKPFVLLGQLWSLGEHLLLCADSTQMASYQSLLKNKTVDLVLTDLPYNVNYQAQAGQIINDNMSLAKFKYFLKKFFQAVVQVMALGAPIYVSHSDVRGILFREAFISSGLKLASCLIWPKNQMVLGRSDYQWRHEPILYG